MPDGDQRDAAAGSRIVIVAVLQFAVVGLLALAIVAITTGIASRRVGQREAIANARTTTVLKAQSVVAPAITEGVRRGDPEALAELDRVVREEVLDDEIVRVKLWDSGGRIVYSDAPELIGSTYELGADDLEALQEGRIEAEVSDLSEPENRFERQYGKLLEVYLPIGDDPDDALLFEAYYRYEAVNAAGSQLWRSFAPIALGGLIVLELVQIPLAYSLARRLRDRMREREALTRRALEASEIERRQIASDLHDGVVQDLTGVAYALSAAARRGSGALPEAEVEAAATTVRDAVRDLRSMVVDLVPMSVDEGGLTAALEELAQRMSSDELTISVAADELPGTAAQGHRPRALSRRPRGFAQRRAPRRRGGGGRAAGLRRRTRGARDRRRRQGLRPGHAGGTSHRGPRGPTGPAWPRCRLRRVAGALVPCRRRHVAAHRGAGHVIRVVIVDDHAVVRSGLQSLLDTAGDIEVVGAAADGAEAIELVASVEPDVVLMDLSMRGVDGVAATAAITKAHSDMAVVVLTSFSEPARITAALEAGAIGYQLKDAAPDELIAAVRAAAAGGAPLDPQRGPGAARQAGVGAAGPRGAEQPRAGRAPAGHRRPRQQADRPPPRHRRAHGEGPPDEHLRAHRRQRPDPGRAVGPAAPARGS